MPNSNRPPVGGPLTRRSLWRGAAASRTLRFTGIVSIALLSVWMVAQHRADGSQARPRPSIGSRTGWLWQPPQGSTAAAEIRLDDLFDEATFDRRTVGGMAQTLVGDREPVDAMSVGRFLDLVPRLRLTYGEMSIVVEREALTRIAQSLAGGDATVDDVRVGVLLDRLPYFQARVLIRRARLAGRLQEALSGAPHDGPIATALREAIGDIEPVSLAHDAGFAERRAMQLQYAATVRIVKDIQRAGSTGLDRDTIYDQAFYRLVEQDRVEAVPLLDGYRRLQEELASDRLVSMTYPERIAYRWEARRRAFGPEAATLLFSREEAMERWQIDSLRLQADPALTEEERTGRIRDRREALKVELAAQGTYVGFPGGSGGAVRQP